MTSAKASRAAHSGEASASDGSKPSACEYAGGAGEIWSMSQYLSGAGSAAIAEQRTRNAPAELVGLQNIGHCPHLFLIFTVH